VLIPLTSLARQVLEHRRSQLDDSRVRYYMEHPDEIRGVLVYENPGDGERIVVNGCHRTEAALRLGRVELDVELRSGTRQDALAYRDLDERRRWAEVERDADR